MYLLWYMSCLLFQTSVVGRRNVYYMPTSPYFPQIFLKYACICFCLLRCQNAWLPTWLPARMPEGLPAKVPECLPARMPACQDPCQPEYLPAKLQEWLISRVPECPPTCCLLCCPSFVGLTAID
jgi:hypothetical protein